MGFKDRAKKAGAFGQAGLPEGLHYSVSKTGVGLGWIISHGLGGPCLCGLYSEAKPSEFRRGLRWVLHRTVKDLRREGYDRVAASIEYQNKRFIRLFRAYQSRAGATVVGEHESGVVLIFKLDALEAL